MQQLVTVSMQELDRMKCIEAVIDGSLTPIRAAERMGLTTRQVRRLAMRYRVEGPVGLVSRRRKQPSNNRLEAGLEARVLKILRESYADFGPTLAAEKLAERHKIVLSKETVRRLLVGAGLWTPLVFVRSSLLALQKDSEAGDVSDTRGKHFYARAGSAEVYPSRRRR